MKIAFVFPGQGSQSVGMLNTLAADFQEVTEVFSRASDILGYDLWNVVSEGPAEDLNQTHITQPAMLASGVAVWEVWKKLEKPMPQIMAGHSLGEYTALVCANALSFEDGIALVAERGRLMQEAVPQGTGAMAAILGLDDDSVRSICASSAAGQVVEAVNFNSPGQVVIAGDKDAVDRAMVAAKDAGAKRALPLPVSVPSHCALMQPAAEKLKLRLASVTINKPDIPVLHNYSVSAHDEAEEIKLALVSQLYNPVRWVETVQTMFTGGVDTIVECGPGKVLTGLNKRIIKEINAVAVYDPETINAALS